MMQTSAICRSADTVVSFFLKDEKLWLGSMRNGGKERAICSPISLPSSYRREGAAETEPIPFAWRAVSSEKMQDGYRVLFCDEAAGCSYEFRAKGRSDIAGPIEISGRLLHTSGEPIRLLPGELFSAVLAFAETPTAWTFMKESGVAENVRWHHAPETFFPGSGIYRELLDHEVIAETNTCQDFNSGGKIPIIYLDGGDLGAYLAMEWTSLRLHAVPTEGGVRVSADLREGFSTCLPVGRDLIVPPIYLGVYEGDVDDGSNLFKRWFFLEKTPKIMLQNEQEPLAQMDYQIHPSRVHELGIQSVKWDYGWWAESGTHETGWTIHEGSWHLRRAAMLDRTRENGVNSLVEYADYLHSFGLNFTVYVLLHDSRVELDGDEQLTSVGPTAHPEWFSDRKIGGVCPVADLGNEECVAYCKRKLHAFFTQNHIDSWRSDFEPIAMFSDKKNRHDANGTDVQYWCSRGFYDIVDFLIETIPGFRYESCSSGGSMKDYATMHRTPVFNNDDSADYLSLRTTFYDSSYCFPPAQLQAPCNPDTFCPESEVHYAGFGNMTYGMRSMLMGGLMFGSWSGPKDGHLQYGLEELFAEYIPLHNEKIKPLIRHANLYHTLPRPDQIHWDGMQYGCSEVPENRIGGVLFLFKPTNEEGSTKTVRIRGLNPDLTYRADFYERKGQSFIATGAELMEKGLTCTIEEETGSEIVFFEIAEEARSNG